MEFQACSSQFLTRVKNGDYSVPVLGDAPARVAAVALAALEMALCAALLVPATLVYPLHKKPLGHVTQRGTSAAYALAGKSTAPIPPAPVKDPTTDYTKLAIGITLIAVATIAGLALLRYSTQLPQPDAGLVKTEIGETLTCAASNYFNKAFELEGTCPAAVSAASVSATPTFATHDICTANDSTPYPIWDLDALSNEPPGYPNPVFTDTVFTDDKTCALNTSRIWEAGKHLVCNAVYDSAPTCSSNHSLTDLFTSQTVYTPSLPSFVSDNSSALTTATLVPLNHALWFPLLTAVTTVAVMAPVAFALCAIQRRYIQQSQHTPQIVRGDDDGSTDDESGGDMGLGNLFQDIDSSKGDGDEVKVRTVDNMKDESSSSSSHREGSDAGALEERDASKGGGDEVSTTANLEDGSSSISSSKDSQSGTGVIGKRGSSGEDAVSSSTSEKSDTQGNNATPTVPNDTNLSQKVDSNGSDDDEKAGNTIQNTKKRKKKGAFNKLMRSFSLKYVQKSEPKPKSKTSSRIRNLKRSLSGKFGRRLKKT